MAKSKWMVAQKKADFDAIATEYGIDPVLARIIRNREVISDEDIELFLKGDMSYLHDPMLMKGMKEACQYIREAIAAGKKIRIIGDYDVDGICATYILLRGFRELGAIVDTVIPHRIKDGYGLNDQLILDAFEDGINLIVTCDNGIAAASQIALAKEKGIDVIITDHHEVPYDMIDGTKCYNIPKALCVVDPKQEDCTYPYPNICGAFIAFKLVTKLTDASELIEELIPFAAMATVCDVMELLDENRVIVKEGLKRMKAPINTGLRALKMVAGLGDKDISAYHFGFVLGPTVNATGRLDAARRALELFGASSYNEACLIATELKQLNEKRKQLTEDGAQSAVEMIEASDMRTDHVLVVYLPECHESLAGIIAGRIKEKYYRPTIILTDAEDGIKGSGRSVEGYDMYEELSRVKDMMTKFGGHTMAAGLSLPSADCIAEFRRRLNEYESMSEEVLTRKVHIDAPMPLGYINQKLVASFEKLEPCGVANPQPMFATKNISLISYRKIGKNRLIGKLKVMDEAGRSYELVYFDDLGAFDEFLIGNYGKELFEKSKAGNLCKGELALMIAYGVGINTFNSISQVQIVMKYYDVCRT